MSYTGRQVHPIIQAMLSTLGQELVCYSLEKGNEGSRRKGSKDESCVKYGALFSEVTECHMKKSGLGESLAQREQPKTQSIQ